MNRWLQKWVARFGLESRPRLRRFLIGTIGFSVVLIGLVMIVLLWTRNYHRPTWLRYSGQRIRLGAPRLAARHHSGFCASAANPFRGSQSKRDDMPPNCLALQRNTDFQSARPAEFYSADVMVHRASSGLETRWAHRHGMPMFHLSANRNETYSRWGLRRLNR